MPGPGIRMDIEVSKFLRELFKDKESLKIFRQFWNRGVITYLADRNAINDFGVYINVRDSVKKVAQWLATGKN